MAVPLRTAPVANSPGLRAGPAGAAVLRDLVDALTAEDLFGFRSEAVVDPVGGAGPLPLAGGEALVRVPVGPGASVVFRAGRLAGGGDYHRLSRPPVLLVGAAGPPRPLTPGQLLELAARSEPVPGLAEVLAALEAAVDHGTALLAAAKAVARALRRPRPVLADWERLTALGDRPFHPAAWAKQGWGVEEHARYSAASGEPFGLDWVAVGREYMVAGPMAAGPSPAGALLAPAERDALVAAAAAAGVGDGHVLLPVHPWQRHHVLPAAFAGEFRSGVCVAVAGNLGSFLPTSSVRTLAPAGGGAVHVKLPLGVSSLGALRLLPPRYLGNAARAQALLAGAAAAHPGLGRRLRWCDEGAWWAFAEEGFGERAGHLGCLLRTYPAGTGDLVPLGALGVVTPGGRAPGIARLLADRGVDPDSPAAALALVAEVGTRVTEAALACFGLGLMPEVHGQNVLLALRRGAVDGIVLRDHDTLRVYGPWLAAAGLADPGYVFKPGTPNSLLAATPEELLAWFQTLGVQVALGAVARAASLAYGIGEAETARVLAGVLRAGWSAADLPRAAAAVARRQLFESPTWPYKRLIGPWLTRRGSGGGSMPSGMGTIPNPLSDPSARAGAARAGELAAHATVERLLNCYLRESGAGLEAAGGAVTIRFPAAGRSLSATLTFRSVTGHHRFTRDVRVSSGNGTPDHRLAGASEAARLLAAELAAGDPDRARAAARQDGLRAQVADSEAKTRRFLERRLHEPEPGLLGAGERFLAAEQSVLLGHPLHPAAKSSEGFEIGDLDAYAPELRAAFPLHWLAVAPELLAEGRLAAGISLDPPAAVARAAAERLGPARASWPLLPCHPWQAAYLAGHTPFAELVAGGRAVPLGPLGPPVQPTSSVRTVWDGAAGRLFKLPLGVRITNFVRVNPPEQLRRSLDVSRAVAGLGPLDRALELEPATFRVVLELGHRALDVPAEAGLCAATGVVYRAADGLGGPGGPMVLAALLEPSLADGVPPLVQAVRRTGTGPAHVAAWLGRYLDISLVPLVRLAASFGIGLEAHTQNSLVALGDGWPESYWVRDLEGGSLNREQARPPGGPAGPAADSPALYSEAEVWRRFGYYVLVNHAGHLIATLAEHLDAPERELWGIVRDRLSGEVRRLGAGPAGDPLRALLDAGELPAKANLISRWSDRGEDPVYVGLANPLASGRRLQTPAGPGTAG